MNDVSAELVLTGGGIVNSMAKQNISLFYKAAYAILAKLGGRTSESVILELVGTK